MALGSPSVTAGLRAADPAGVGTETRGGVVAGLAFVRPYRSQRHVPDGGGRAGSDGDGCGHLHPRTIESRASGPSRRYRGFGPLRLVVAVVAGTVVVVGGGAVDGVLLVVELVVLVVGRDDVRKGPCTS